VNNPTLPQSVNFHLLQPCNMHCRFCYATFHDVAGKLDKPQSIALIRKLAAAGFQKITFAGGEPTLCKWLPDLVHAAKAAGMTTMLVTNGTLLHKADWVFAPDRPLDWVALSIDSASADTHIALGRSEGGKPITRARYIRLARRIREAGIRLKVNTVVTSLTIDEDMSDFIRALAPERWKVLRVLPVGGQNDGKVEPLLVTHAQFAAFAKRHAHLANDGITIVNEDHEDIMGGYAMIDPIGRFFDDTKGHHTYSRPILDVGVDTAFAEVTFSQDRFVKRGGVYQWQGKSTKREPPGSAHRLVALSGRSGSGKDAVAGHLVERGYVRVAIADTLKRAMQSLFELDEGQLWGDGRNVVVERLGATPRELYQRFSDACTAIDPDVWLRPWRSELERRLAAGERIVCSDIRTKAELAVITALGGTRIRLRRPGACAPGAAGAHHTETEMDDVDDDELDAVVENDADLDTLFARIDALVERRG
jgi:radical S-adenosyl methionine domain-containing protein 2